MAEVKAEAVCEGEKIDGVRDLRLNLSSSLDPPPSDISSIEEVVNKTSGTMMKAPPGPMEAEVKDFPGQESIIPLSPQWLFSKHGDGKPTMTPIDLPQTPVSASNGNTSDSVSKERWRPDSSRDAEKRRDWWRTMATEGDGSAGNRRERWRDDERESSLLGRRDRWKEGGDNTDRRADRWTENLSTARDPPESRRTPLSERRSDTTSRETNYETRRDSKWNTRWGPEDKDKETRRDKRLDTEKEGEGHRDKQHPSGNRNENDREVDASARDRWRPHSITARSKGEMPPPLSSTPPKPAPGFGIGRGRGDTSSTGFAVGRGRANLSGINPLHGMFTSIGSPPGIERADGGSGFRYPRAKLLDIYRKCSVSFLNKKYPEGFSEAPQLTQSDPFEPLAFFTPDMDEEAVLEGILKGDVLNSGAVHSTPKEQTGNKVRENNSWNRARGRSIGNKEEGLSDTAKEDSFSGVRKADEISIASHEGQSSGDVLGIHSKREILALTSNSHIAGQSIKQSSMSELNESLKINIAQDKFNEMRTQESGAPMNRVSASGGQDGCTGGSYEKIEVLDKLTGLSLNKNSEGGILSHSDGKKLGLSPQIAPEELSLFYIDPQGEVQGPFPGSDIIDWFKAGFFGTDLLVRTADSPEGAQFTQLSKVMPHLQATSQAPSTTEVSKEVADYLESNDRMTKAAFNSNYLQQAVAVSDPSGRSLPMGAGGNLQAEGGRYSVSGNVDGWKEMKIDKLSERERVSAMNEEAAMLKRASSLPQRMAGLPHNQNEDLQSLLQHWPERGSALPEKPGLIPRSAGHASRRAELLHGAPDLFLPPAGSAPLERSWSDLSLAKETQPHHLPSHGLDAFHMHQLQQLEKHRIQQQLEHGLPLPRLLQQQQHLRQQQLAEQLLSPGHSHHDLSLHALQQLANPRVPPRLQHQQSFPMQASESTLDQLLRLHQQQQAPSHAYLEQLLRQYQQLPGVEHLHGSPILTERHLRRLQEAARTDIQAQQVEQLLQRHSHELFLQRQQEHQARQHAFLLQQQLSNLHEQRVSGVWEVDEFGQFVQTPASNPMHPQENFHQQQLQRHPSFPPLHHPGAPHGGVSGAHSPHLRLSRSDLRKLADLELQKNLTSLLDGTTSMPSEMLAQLQSEIARFEAQSLPLPKQGPYELQAQNMQNIQSNPEFSGDSVAGRGWNASHDVDKQAMEMLNRGAGSASMFDHLSGKSEMLVPHWQQDTLSSQTDLNRRSRLLAINAEENLGSVLRAHNRSEKLADQSATEDISRVLSSHSSFSGQRGNSPPPSFHDQQVMANSWAGERVPVDSDPSLAPARASQLFEPAGPLKANHWDMNWSKADMGVAVELPTKVLSNMPTVLSNQASGVAGEARAPTPAPLHDDFDFNDLKDGAKQNAKLKDDDQSSSASFLRSGSVKAEDFREVLSTPGHLLGETQQGKEDNAGSRLAVWSVDTKNQVKTANSLKEISEIPRIVRNELEGVPLSVHQQMQVNDRLPSTVLLTGNMPSWQQAPSPSSTKNSAASNHSTTIRSTTPGDDEFFWDHTNTGNGRQYSRPERFDKFSISAREQFAKGPSTNDEVLMHQAFAAGAAHVSGFSELSGLAPAVTKPVQPIARGLRGNKQADDMPILTPQGSLTIADAKAFREWCEEQINLRRGLNASDYLESGPAFEALKAEFLRHKDSMPSEATHAAVPVTADSAVADNVETEKRTSDKPKKSSEGEDDPDSETCGQNSAAKSAKKKAKKGKKVVDPSLLGFSVASNRMLMGEIQHVDD
ncbi:hypothetical protein L7F22_055552 [Adiantum nelumboides]|nr:hypothetical protein [Adiantum nelumboides]